MAEFPSWLPALTLCVVTAICYTNSLGCGFVFDDVSAIKDNKDLRPQVPISNLIWNDFWGTPMHKEKSHKSYRPLCVLTFRWNYFFSGLEPMSYHLVNVLLHGVVCVLYFRLCKLFLSCGASFLSALLFAVHPIHTEAVTGVVGRAELLSSIFFISALMFYAKSTGYRSKTGWHFLFLTVIFVTIAMLCKEQGITVIGVCCVYEVFVAQRMSINQITSIISSVLCGRPQIPSWLWTAVLRTFLLVGSTVFLLLARVKIMGAQLPVFTKFDNPASVSPTPTRQMTLNYLLPLNAWLLLSPSALCCDWTMGTVPLVESIADPRNIATLIFYTVVGMLVVAGLKTRGPRSRAIIMSVAMTTLPFIPASNLFFPVGFVVAERILYAPSMGFCMLVGMGFEMLVKHINSFKPVLWSCLALLIFTHSVKTYVRNKDWKSEYTLFQSALKVNQNNAKLYNNVGHALESEAKYTEALSYFSQAASVQPDDIGAHINVGRSLNLLNRTRDAEVAYRKALDLFPPVKPGQSYTARVAPNHLNVFINLGSLIAKDEKRLSEADALYRSAISMRPDYTQAYINRGDVLMRMKRVKDAQEQYEIARHYESDNPDIYYNLGVVLLEQGQKVKALENFNEALTWDKDHKQSLFNSAVLIQEIGDPKLRSTAISRLKNLMRMEPNNEKIYFNLGMLAMDDKKFTEAESWFITAVKLKADFRSALFNLALLLVNDLHKPMDAVPYLKQLLQYYPTHTKGLILMGDLNINYLKDLPTAKENFMSILGREPNNVQAKHNLCVVYVEEGDLKRAETCLVETVKLSPKEEYIQRHLAIVRSRLQQINNKEKAKTP